MVGCVKATTDIVPGKFLAIYVEQTQPGLACRADEISPNTIGDALNPTKATSLGETVSRAARTRTKWRETVVKEDTNTCLTYRILRQISCLSPSRIYQVSLIS